MTATPAPARLQAVDSLRRSVQSLTVELLAVYEELALLYSVSSQIGRLADEDQIAAVALKEAMEISQADCGWVALWDADHFRVPECCRIGIERGTIDQVNHRVLESLIKQTKGGLLSHALPQDFPLDGDGVPYRFLASALRLDGNVRGYLCLGRERSRAQFLSPDQKLISAVALLIAVEFENVRLQRSELDRQQLVRELQLARSIQQSLLPRDFSAVSFLEGERFQ